MKLFISTATDKIYLMTFTNEQIIKKVIHQGKNNHTQTLYQLIEQLDCKLEDIEEIYVVNGPGSYTGLRVGVIFAKTLSMLHKIDIIPVGLMPCLYHSNQKAIVNVDAKGKKFYQYDGKEIKLVANTELIGLVDPLIDLDELFSSKYLETLESVHYLDLSIEYVKDAI